MSYQTDKLREDANQASGVAPIVNVPGQMLDEILQSVPVKRRTMLRGSLGASLTALFGAGSLAACGGGSDTPATTTVDPFEIGFESIPASRDSNLHIPTHYEADVLYSSGDALISPDVRYNSSALSLADLEKVGGGQHDGMHFYEIPGRDPNKNGLLAINHENTDGYMLDLGGRTTADQNTAKLSNVGVAVVEVKLNETTDKWEVVVGSTYNRRYTGNTIYKSDGPAAGSLGEINGEIIGTLNNCASGRTPWGTYLTCEETTRNYFDESKDAKGYGWVVEIDPLGEISQLATPIKHTAMGRFAHENTAYSLNANNRLAFYMGDDTTPGGIYKFVPHGRYNPNNREANINLLSHGKLYVAKFNANGSGQWLELSVGKNGLHMGVTDPGRTDRTYTPPATPPIYDFATQADVVINCQVAARIAGGTMMDRPEWISVGPDGTVYCTLTSNGDRTIVNPANPRAENARGHIIQWHETGNDVAATTFTWEIFVLAGSPEESNPNSQGNINGDPFASPDGLDVDHKGRLWVQTDSSTSGSTNTIFGNNGMYNMDPNTGLSRRFLVGPYGCEITGLTYTPDLKTFFINVQHPGNNWPTVGGPGRSSTVVVRHQDRKPVGSA